VRTLIRFGLGAGNLQIRSTLIGRISGLRPLSRLNLEVSQFPLALW